MTPLRNASALAFLFLVFFIAAGCNRKGPMDKCLEKDLDQCEAVCMNPTTAPNDVGLSCSAASSKYMKATPPDVGHAEMLLDHACSGGASEICISLGNRSSNARNRDKARSYFKKACDGNYQPGCKAIDRMDEQAANRADAGAPAAIPSAIPSAISPGDGGAH